MATSGSRDSLIALEGRNGLVDGGPADVLQPSGIATERPYCSRRPATALPVLTDRRLWPSMVGPTGTSDEIDDRADGTTPGNGHDGRHVGLLARVLSDHLQRAVLLIFSEPLHPLEGRGEDDQ